MRTTIILVGCGMLLMTSCAVPNPTETNIELVAPYKINAFAVGNTIRLEITGHYTINFVPYFGGYNIYYGQTPNAYTILKRRIAVHNEKPTISLGPSKQGDISTNIVLRNFRFKLNKNSDYITEPIYQHTSYFFIVRAFNFRNSKEGTYNNVITEVRPSMQLENISISLPANSIQHDSFNFSFTTTNTIRPSGGMGIHPIGFKSENAWKRLNLAPKDGYNTTGASLEQNHAYWLKSNTDYAKLYIVRLAGNQCVYHFYYQKNSRFL